MCSAEYFPRYVLNSHYKSSLHLQPLSGLRGEGAGLLYFELKQYFR